MMLVFEVVWPRPAFSCLRGHSLALGGPCCLFLGALWEGPDSSGCGHSHRASPFFSLGSLCVSGTRRGAPSGGGRLGSSSDFPRLTGCRGRD